MNLEHYDQDILKGKIREIAQKNLKDGAYSVFFFGSRVAGTNDERSDIDVGIEGAYPVSPVAMENIREEIEDIPTLYTIDVVDFSRVPASFRDVAKKHTKKII